MTEEQKKDALEMLIIIKEKHDGTIKARGCAGWCKQHEKHNNADATSPTVSTEAVLIPVVIDAYEVRDVTVVDIPCVYLSAYMDNDVFMIFCGTRAELMVAANLTLYRKYIS